MRTLPALSLSAMLGIAIVVSCTPPEPSETGEDTGRPDDTSDASDDTSDTSDTSDDTSDTSDDTSDASDDTSDASDDTSDTSDDTSDTSDTSDSGWTNCDGLCVTTLEVQLSTDATTFSIRVVIPELSMDQTFACAEGALLVTGTGPNAWTTCEPTGIEVLFEDTNLAIPASIQLGVNGDALQAVAPVLTEQSVCGTFCVSGSVFF